MGITGPFSFTGTAPNRQVSNFEINQYDKMLGTHTIGFWNATGSYVSQRLLHFNTFPDIPISKIPPQTTIFGENIATVITTVVAGFLLTICLGMLVVVTLKRDTRIVAVTGFCWIWTVYVGIILLLTSMILWTFSQTTFTCVSKAIAGMLGVGLING